MKRLIAGPPGAGKNTYIEKNKKDGDIVVDLDQMREQYPWMSPEELKEFRKNVELSVSGVDHEDKDVWIIRCAADADKRSSLVTELGIEEVVVLETDADTAKARIRERGRDTDLEQIDSAVDSWWSQYGVVGSDVIVRPDSANTSDTENKMTKNNEGGTDKGFPADTPVAEMEPLEQVAYWKYNSRKHENASKAKDTEIETLKASKSEAVDVDELTKTIRENLAKENAPALVAAQFKSAVGGRLDDAALASLVEDLDHTKYLNEDGTVNSKRVSEKAAIFAPEVIRRSVRTHQGKRSGEGGSSVARGAALYESKHGSKDS